MPATESTQAKTIRIVVNGEAKAVPQGLRVAQLLEFLSVDPARVAVELDRSIVRKQDWPATPVEEGAQIEVVWFVGGG
jgi:sulfur carrier protein